MKGLCTVAFLVRIGNWIIQLFVTVNRFPNNVRSTLVIGGLLNIIESLYLVLSSLLFLYYSKHQLELKGMELYRELFTKHDGFDFLILIGLRIYICFACIQVAITKSNVFSYPLPGRLHIKFDFPILEI